MEWRKFYMRCKHVKPLKRDVDVRSRTCICSVLLFVLLVLSGSCVSFRVFLMSNSMYGFHQNAIELEFRLNNIRCQNPHQWITWQKMAAKANVKTSLQNSWLNWKHFHFQFHIRKAICRRICTCIHLPTPSPTNNNYGEITTTPNISENAQLHIGRAECFMDVITNDFIRA